MVATRNVRLYSTSISMRCHVRNTKSYSDVRLWSTRLSPLDATQEIQKVTVMLGYIYPHLEGMKNEACNDRLHRAFPRNATQKK